MLPLEARLKAVLFVRGTPTDLPTLERVLESERPALDSAIANLAESLRGSGLALIVTNESVALSTSEEAAPWVKRAVDEDMIADIGKAGFEVLAILLYHGAASRREIDHIRGVNSQQAVRTLLVRGLIERYDTKEKSAVYRVTPATVGFLGVGSPEELPDYALVQAALRDIDTASHTA